MPVDVESTVISNTRLSPEYNVLALDAPAVASSAAPGQFVMIKPSPGHDPLLRRPFSIFERLLRPDGTLGGITLLNKKVGVGTALLYDAEPGQRLPCLGPLGRPFTLVDPPAEAWLVAGGVGLAPFATLADALRVRQVVTTLFYGGRRRQELFFLDLFERLRVRLVLATEDGSKGHHGLVSEPLGLALAATGTLPMLAIYACGPTGMMRAVADLARRHGRRAEVSLEQVMGCGLGGCYSCVVKVRRGPEPSHYVRSCTEGPVFDADEIVWEEMVH
jgi:dihydroorotate dehydrogenase electron transfer subunit